MNISSSLSKMENKATKLILCLALSKTIFVVGFWCRFELHVLFTMCILTERKISIRFPPKILKVQDRIFLTIAGVPSNYIVSQKNQMRYSVFMGLVASLHGCAYSIPVVLYYFCLLWQRSEQHYTLLHFKISLSMSKVVAQAGQPWTTKTIERSKVFCKTVKVNHFWTQSRLPFSNTRET